MQRFMSIACLLAGMVCYSGNVTLAQRQSNPTLQKSTMSTTDREFMKKAAEGGMMEVTLGRSAIQRAGSADVKQFGQRMVTDHTKASNQLKQLARQKGVSLPKNLDSDKRQMMARLMKETGAAFDKAYMQHMVEDHEKDVAEFEKAANECKDSALKSWAAKTLPTLREHLQLARTVASKVGAGGRTAKNSRRIFLPLAPDLPEKERASENTQFYVE
jgi:putative membrane protein